MLRRRRGRRGLGRRVEIARPLGLVVAGAGEKISELRLLVAVEPIRREHAGAQRIEVRLGEVK